MIPGAWELIVTVGYYIVYIGVWDGGCVGVGEVGLGCNESPRFDL